LIEPRVAVPLKSAVKTGRFTQHSALTPEAHKRIDDPAHVGKSVLKVGT